MPEIAAQLQSSPYQPPQISELSGDSLDIHHLCELALEGLIPMFDGDQKLFCYRRRLTPHGLVCEGLSPRYTIMALLGLLRCRAAGMQLPIEIEPVVTRLVDNLSWIDGIGDLGLLLWLCASISTHHLRKLCFNADVKNGLHHFRDAREGMTTEVAWFLAGIAHAALAVPEDRSTFESTARETFELLKVNQGVGGIFGHLARRKTLAATLRSHIGCFADQVYPIYALTRYAEAFESHAALDMASSCAEGICKAQGSLGQWWWHYDSTDGQVFGKYPVFSVHQDGMAPMALFALGDATQRDVTPPVYKGLQWIGGANELRCDLRDNANTMIWRSIHPGGKYKNYIAGALDAIGYDGKFGMVENLQVNFESRPYHFGWLLYAFAGREVPLAYQPKSSRPRQV
jgi:hypothetical protein